MNNLVLVHKVKSPTHLLNQISSHRLSYPPLQLQKLVQLTRVTKLQHEIDVLTVCKKCIHLDYIRMVEKCLYFYLSYQLNHQFAINVHLVYFLYCTKKTCSFVPRDKNLTKFTSTQFLTQLKILYLQLRFFLHFFLFNNNRCNNFNFFLRSIGRHSILKMRHIILIFLNFILLIKKNHRKKISIGLNRLFQPLLILLLERLIPIDHFPFITIILPLLLLKRMLRRRKQETKEMLSNIEINQQRKK